MNKKVKLSQGKFALVDGADFDWLNQWKWCYKEGYANRGDYSTGKKNNISMHRLIVKCPKGMQVDHINGDRLDNRRINLRICTRHQNIMNQRRNPVNKSCKYKGVSWHKTKNKYQAQIGFENKDIHLGSFICPKMAAVAYNNAAVKYFGEFACINQL